MHTPSLKFGEDMQFPKVIIVKPDSAKSTKLLIHEALFGHLKNLFEQSSTAIFEMAKSTKLLIREIQQSNSLEARNLASNLQGGIPRRIIQEKSTKRKIETHTHKLMYLFCKVM
jgi:hypothetical protein